jgi:hypothetical protein
VSVKPCFTSHSLQKFEGLKEQQEQRVIRKNTALLQKHN